MPNSTVPANGNGLWHVYKVSKVTPETIEKHEMEQALRDAQFALDVQLHDLRSEFLQRESKLRQEYLNRVAQITTA